MYNQTNPSALTEQNQLHIKKFLKSPLIPALGIIYCIAAILPIAFVATYSNNLSKTFETLSAGLQTLFLAYGDITGIFDVGTIIIVISAVLSPLILALSFILMFINSRNTSPSVSPKSGASLLVVGAFATLAGMGFAITMIAGSLIELFDETDLSMLPDEIISQIIRIGILALVYLLYSISLISFSVSLNNRCKSTKLSSGGSVMLGISSVLTAIIYMLFIIDTTADSVDMTDSQSLFISTLAFSAITYLVTAVFSFLYNAHMRKTPAHIPLNEAHPTTYAHSKQNTVNQTLLTDDTTPLPIISATEDTLTFDHIKEASPIIAHTAIRETEDAPSEEFAVVSYDIPAFCPECGTKTAKNQMFCAECGTRL